MGFYYFSILSLPLLGVAYGLLLFLFWGIARLTSGMPGRTALLGVVGVVFLVLPVAEELWIAWNFGQLCRRDAGLFVNKTVKVEGFYSDPATGSLELVKSGGYRFIESRSNAGVHRITYGDADFFRRAVEQYKRANPSKDVEKQDYLRVKLDEDTDVLVYPKKGDSWRIIKLDRPTARYHYRKLYSHKPVAYKIRAFEWVVEDTESKSIVAREKAYARRASWFYIGLERPTMFCPVFGNHGEKLTGGLYRLVLKPSK